MSVAFSIRSLRTPLVGWTLSYSSFMAYGGLYPLVADTGVGLGADASFYVGITSALLCFLLALLGWHRPGISAGFSGWEIFCVAGILGPLLLLLADVDGFPSFLLASFGTVGTGMFVGAGAILLIRLLVGQSMRHIVIALACAHVAGSTVSTFVGMIGSRWLIAAFLMAAPVGWGWSMRSSRARALQLPLERDGDADVQEGRNRGSAMARVPLRPVCLMLLTVFASSLVRGSTVAGSEAASYLGSLLCAAIIGVAVVVRRRRVRFRFLYNLALFFLLLGLLLCTVEDVGVRLVASCLANGGYVAFDIFINALLCHICARYSVSPLWVFGLLDGSANLVFEMGYGCGVMFSYLAEPSRNFAAFALAVVVAMAFALLFTDRDYRTSWGMVKEGTALSPIADFYEDLPERCALVVQQYGLSRREEDVLLLLAQRKTAADIERELFISNATVKSHVRNIYRKLGIHKKDELLKLMGHPSMRE